MANTFRLLNNIHLNTLRWNSDYIISNTFDTGIKILIFAGKNGHDKLEFWVLYHPPREQTFHLKKKKLAVRIRLMKGTKVFETKDKENARDK